jgi:hypothetical protein
MPNQYAKFRERGESIKNYKVQTYSFLDELLEVVIKILAIYETKDDVDFGKRTPKHSDHAKLIISSSLHNEYMNLLYLPEKYHIIIFIWWCRYI